MGDSSLYKRAPMLFHMLGGDISSCRQITEPILATSFESGKARMSRPLNDNSSETGLGKLTQKNARKPRLDDENI